MSEAEVGIIMGSTSDLAIMEEASRVLDSFGIGYDITISSGHRSPERTIAYATSASQKGIKVIIVGAGAAAHLAGTIAQREAIVENRVGCSAVGRDHQVVPVELCRRDRTPTRLIVRQRIKRENDWTASRKPKRGAEHPTVFTRGVQ